MYSEGCPLNVLRMLTVKCTQNVHRKMYSEGLPLNVLRRLTVKCTQNVNR